jgi:hypothetical protein
MGEETIKLYGGPRDGEVLGWLGRDTVEFPVLKREAAHVDFNAPNEPVTYETALYRRSLKTPSIFVFQP